MEEVSAMFPVVVDPSSYSFSPSQLLGLATPPLATPPASQRATPAASFNDMSTSLQPSTAGTVSASPQLVTPTPEVTPREAMLMGEDGDRPTGGSSSIKTTPTPFPPRPGPRTTPVYANRPHGSSAFASPFLPRPTSSSSSQPPSLGPSPMKRNQSSESIGSQHVDSGAARTLCFESIPERKEDRPPKHLEMRMGKDMHTGAAAAGPVPMESLPSIVHNLSVSESANDSLDQEVSRITEGDESFDTTGSSFTISEDGGTSASAPKQLKTAESVIQFMKQVNRIRFNSLTSHNGETLVYPAEKHSRPGRPRSCPPLRRKPLVGDPHFPPSPNSTANSKLDTVSESAVNIHGRHHNSDCCSGGSGGGGGGGTSFLSAQLSQDWTRSPEGGSHEGGSEGVCTCQGRAGRGGGGEGVCTPRMQQFASVFQCLLAPVQVGLCRQCQVPLVSAGQQGEPPAEGAARSQQGETTWTSWPRTERALFSALSPPELLDRHLIQGSELHAKELAHIPLTSKETVSWTHFGGGPPVDEINILRGENLMLQNQVMYERHKRSNHAMRNRRLLRRIAHVVALEEQVQALTDELELKVKDIQNLQVSLKLLQDHNHQLQQTQDSDEYERLVDFKTTIQQNKDLQEANIELKNLLLTQKAENDDLKKELQQVRARCFELEKDNEMMGADMASASKWKDQVVELQKELLLMGEAHERLQNHLHHQQRQGQEMAAASSSMLVQALKAEIKELKKDKTDNSLTLEATLCRLADLEEFGKSKDVVMAQMKTNFEAAKSTHAEELKAVEDKYHSLVHLGQQMEAHILQLQSHNDSLQQKLVSSQIRASRRRANRDPSPDASAGTSPGQAEADVTPTPTPTPTPCMEKREGAGETGMDTAATDRHDGRTATDRHDGRTVTDRRDGRTVTERHDGRTVSQMSQDSGRGSMVTPAEQMTPTVPKNTSSKPAKPSPRDSSQQVAPPTPVEPQGDEVSQSSDGPQGLAASRAMMYTDSEDNCSFSSTSNVTTDSGVYSKLEPAS